MQVAQANQPAVPLFSYETAPISNDTIEWQQQSRDPEAATAIVPSPTTPATVVSTDNTAPTEQTPPASDIPAADTPFDQLIKNITTEEKQE
jgi:hypothetical protein